MEELELIIITGGETVEYSHSSISYKVKCVKCGNVEPRKYSYSLSKGITEVSTIKCTACGHSQVVKIRYLIEN